MGGLNSGGNLSEKGGIIFWLSFLFHPLERGEAGRVSIFFLD